MAKQNDITIRFLKRMERERFLDLRDILGNHAARLLLGGGFEFTSEDEKISQWWEDFKVRNNFTQMLHTIVYMLSKNGRMVATVNISNGLSVIQFADPNRTIDIGKIYLEKEVAIIYTNPIKDDVSYEIREVWDKEKVVRTGIYKGQSITIQEINVKLDEGNQIEPIWYHNLGFLPLVEFLNKNINVPLLAKGSTNSGQLSYRLISDDYPVSNIRRLIDVGYRTKVYETAFNISKSYGNFDKTKLEKIRREGGILSYMLNKAVVDIKGYGEKGMSSDMTIQEANPNLSTYNDSIQKDWEKYFEGAGYSSPEQAAMDTATQVLYAKSRDVETTNQKRELITPCLLELIDKCLIVDGLETGLPTNDTDRKYSFSIHQNLQVSETEKLNNIQLKMSMGLITKAEAIAMDRGISKEEAEEVDKAIKAEQEEQIGMLQQQNAAMFGMGQNGGEPGANKGQPGGEKAPKKEVKEKGKK